MVTSLEKGKYIEAVAARYLMSNSLLIVSKNFSCAFGEIDLICQDFVANQIVFVEVKYRKSFDFVEPVFSVDKNKQNKLIKTVGFYFKKYYYEPPISYRFDVVCASGEFWNLNIEWFINAF